MKRVSINNQTFIFLIGALIREANYQIISTYKEFDKNAESKNISKANINGVFGPNLDFSDGMINKIDQYIDIGRNFKEKGIISLQNTLI